MKKVVVTTTINNPTSAIERFDNLPDWTLVVAGDLKTPKDYKLKNGYYFSPKEQEKYNPKLSNAIGWNNHGRRNMGNLIAKDMGADVIAIVDDDNIPYEHWGTDLIVGTEAKTNFYDTELCAFDPIGATNYPHLWHRGFPMQLVSQRDYSKKSTKSLKVDIQADFWNGDPDIDAVGRMIYKPECTFDESAFPIASNKVAPFNSQNIFISKDVLPYYFVLPHITPYGRMSDIWIAFHMHWQGFQVVFNKPSVYQERNPHDLTIDMVDEYIGYEKCIKITEAITNKSYKESDFWPEVTLKAFEAYRECFQ